MPRRRRNPAANPPNPQTETPAFRRWFGKSVVVDADGKPLRVYHGTYGDFEVFDRFFMRSRGRESLDQVGSWFSTEPGKSGAGMYISDTVEGANIVPVYLSIQHPWNVTFRGMWRAAQRMSGQDENARPNAASVQALDDWMDAVGIDGIHIRPDARNGAEFAGQDVWVARRPTQIKSAIGNRGTFDPEDPSIVRNPRRKNPEDTPVLRLTGFRNKYGAAAEAFLHEMFEESYPNPLNPRERILADIEVAVEVSPLRGGVHLDEVRALHPGKGEGTKAMRFLTQLADKHGVTLTLFPMPFGDQKMDTDDLVRFYRKHGFRFESEESDEDETDIDMIRFPRQKNPRRGGLDVRRGIPGTYRTRFVAKGGRKRAYPAQGGAPWDRAMVRVARETTLSGGRIYDTVERASRAGRASAPGKRGSVTVERVTNPRRRNPVTFYHVTEQENVPDILAEGFYPGWGDVGYGVYFYGTLESAKAYAKRGGWDRSLKHPVILAVSDPRIRKIEEHELDPSWDRLLYTDMYVLDADEADDGPVLPRSTQVVNPRRKNPPRKKFSAAPLTEAEKQQVRRANVYLMDWVCDGWGPLPPRIAAFEERHGALTNAEQRELIDWYENRPGELDV